MQTQNSWALQEHFCEFLHSQGVDKPSSYFGHRHNGYQRYRHGALLELVASAAAVSAAERMLDIGCANGDLTYQIAKTLRSKEAYGIDFVPEILAQASRDYPTLHLKVGTLPELEFSGAFFEFVVASEVIYYLTPEGRRLAIDNISRVLKPRGLLLFTSVLGERYFTVESALDLVASQFEVLEVRYDYMRLYHRLTLPFLLLSRVHALVLNGTLPNNPRLRVLLLRLQPALKLRLVRWLLQPLFGLADRVLRSERLPRLCSRLSGALLPGCTRSNIMLLCRKRP